MITITKVGSLVKIDGIEGKDNVYESISNFQGARMSADGTQLSLQIGEVNIDYKPLANFTIGGTVPTNAATVQSALATVFPSAAPATALPTEYPATYAAMQASITSDPTTKRDFFVSADETNGGELTRYFYDGTDLSRITKNAANTYPQYNADSTNKMIVQSTANQYYLFAGNKQYGYKLFILSNNITTQTNSLAASSSDTTSWRVTEVAHCVDVLVGHTTPSGTFGTWSNLSITQGVPSYNSGTALQARSSSTGSAYIEYTVVVGNDRKVTVVLIASSSSSNNVKISVDGVDVLTGLNLANATQTRYEFEVNANPGSRVIRITNMGAVGSFLHSAGVNVSSLKDHVRGRAIDSYGYYINTANYSKYTNTVGANDVAIYDLDANKWGGSFHGGESGISSSFILDGVTTIISTTPKVAAEIKLSQTYTVNWAAQGGAALTMRSLHRFAHANAYVFRVFSVGTIRVRDFMTTLFCVNPSFTQVLAPLYKDLTTYSIGDVIPLCKANQVTYRNPTTDQSLTISHVLFGISYSAYGAPRVWKDANYNKYYYGIADSSDIEVTDVSGFNVYEFD